MKKFIEFIRIHKDWVNLNFIDQLTFKAIITLLGIIKNPVNSIFYPAVTLESNVQADYCCFKMLYGIWLKVQAISYKYASGYILGIFLE